MPIIGRFPPRARALDAKQWRSGCIRATADALWMQALLPQAVGRFRETFPEIELRLRSAGRAEGLCLLDAGDSDLHWGGIEGRQRLPGHLRREPLPAVTMGVVAHRNQAIAPAQQRAGAIVGGNQQGAAVELDDARADVVEQFDQLRAERPGAGQRLPRPHELPQVRQQPPDCLDPLRGPAVPVDGISDRPDDAR